MLTSARPPVQAGHSAPAPSHASVTARRPDPNLLALIRRLSAPRQSPGTLRLLALYGPFTCQWHRWHVRNQYVPFIYVSRTWPFLLLRSYNSNPILSSHQLYTDSGPKPVRATSYLVCVLAGRKQCWLLNNSWQDCGNSTPSHCHR